MSAKRKQIQLRGANVSSKKSRGKSSSNELNFPRVACRATPKILVEAMKNFNDAQIKVVEDIGFGQLRHLKVCEVPRALAHYLISSFSEQSCELVLDAERRIHIDEEDVYLTLGLPKGDIDTIVPLSFLRVKYAYMMLTSTVNVLHKDVMREAAEHYQKIIKERPLEINHAIKTYDYDI